jgi:hypothetical protein
MTRAQCQKVQSDLLYTRASKHSIHRPISAEKLCVFDSVTQISTYLKRSKIMRLFDDACIQPSISSPASQSRILMGQLTRPQRSTHLGHSIVAKLLNQHDQFVLEYMPEEHPHIRTTFLYDEEKIQLMESTQAYCHRYPETAPTTWKSMSTSLRTPHRLLCGARIRDYIRGPIINECDACGVAKAKWQIHREPRDLHEGHGHRLATTFQTAKQTWLSSLPSNIYLKYWSVNMMSNYLNIVEVDNKFNTYRNLR